MVAPLDGERHVRALSHTPIAHLDGGCGSRRTQDPPGGRCVLRRGRRDGQRVARCSNRLEPTHRGSFMNSNDSTHGTTEPSTPGDQTNAGGTPRLIGTRACLRCHHELAGQPINRVEPEGLLVVRCTECGQAKPDPRVSGSRPLGGTHREQSAPSPHSLCPRHRGRHRRRVLRRRRRDYPDALQKSPNFHHLEVGDVWSWQVRRDRRDRRHRRDMEPLHRRPRLVE